MCEACYGGALGYEELSVVEKFFEKGGTSFVGSSTIAYGAPDSPLSAADLIAKHYVKGLYDGLAQGEALTRAKAEVLTDDPMDFEVALKTVLSFNLFGLPSQRLIKQESASLISTESTSTSTNTRFSQGSVLNRVRAGLPSSTQASGGLLSSIRDRYRSRLPQRNQQFMIERDQIAKILREFKDFSKVEKILTEMGSSLEDCTLDFVSAGESEGYRLFGFSKKRKAKNTLILFLNKSGQIKKTITSKGRS